LWIVSENREMAGNTGIFAMELFDRLFVVGHYDLSAPDGIFCIYLSPFFCILPFPYLLYFTFRLPFFPYKHAPCLFVVCLYDFSTPDSIFVFSSPRMRLWGCISVVC